MRLIGLDPGLRNTGWGVIEAEGNRLTHVASGVVQSDEGRPLAERLCQLFDGIAVVIAQWQPVEAAVEETFVNKNPTSTLKLGQAFEAYWLWPETLRMPLCWTFSAAASQSSEARCAAVRVSFAVLPSAETPPT